MGVVGAVHLEQRRFLHQTVGDRGTGFVGAGQVVFDASGEEAWPVSRSPAALKARWPLLPSAPTADLLDQPEFSFEVDDQFDAEACVLDQGAVLGCGPHAVVAQRAHFGDGAFGCVVAHPVGAGVQQVPVGFVHAPHLDRHEVAGLLVLERGVDARRAPSGTSGSRLTNVASVSALFAGGVVPPPGAFEQVALERHDPFAVQLLLPEPGAAELFVERFERGGARLATLSEVSYAADGDALRR